MNQKSENNKYDIVLEAEAVLDAYSRRCKVYAKKSARRQGHAFRKFMYGFVSFSLLIVLICWFVNFL